MAANGSARGFVSATCFAIVGYASAASAKSKGVDQQINSSRHYDQVTFVTAHNAFAATDYGWIYAQQGLTITDQLKLGVRGLMLDIHLGQASVVTQACRDVERQVTTTEQQCHK